MNKESFWRTSFERVKDLVQKNKKKSMIIGGAVVLLIVAAIVLLSGSSKEPAAQTQIVTLESGSLSETIDVVGNVKAVPSTTLSWGTSGTVGEIYYQVGDAVKEGYVFAKLSDSSIAASVLQAQTDLLEAQYELDRITTSDAEFQAAAQALEDAEYDYRAKEDARDYWNFNGTNQDVLDEARIVYHDSDTVVWTLQNQYDNLTEDDTDKDSVYEELQDAIFTRDKALRNLNYLLGHSYDHSVETDYIEFEMAEAALQEARINYERYLDNTEEIEAAQARVQALENTVNSASIIAPFDGVITSILFHQGESVSSGSKAVQVDDLNNLVIDIYVSEVDINDIEMGQTVNITFDAIPTKQYSGLVSDISAAGDDSSGIVEFKVSITVSDPDDDIKPGFTAVASIVIQEVADAVLVPNMAITSLNGHSMVMVVGEDGQITPTPVIVQAAGDTYSVLEGNPLSVGDQLVIEINMAEMEFPGAGFGGMLGGAGGGGMGRPQK